MQLDAYRLLESLSFTLFYKPPLIFLPPRPSARPWPSRSLSRVLKSRKTTNVTVGADLAEVISVFQHHIYINGCIFLTATHPGHLLIPVNTDEEGRKRTIQKIKISGRKKTQVLKPSYRSETCWSEAEQHTGAPATLTPRCSAVSILSPSVSIHLPPSLSPPHLSLPLFQHHLSPAPPRWGGIMPINQNLLHTHTQTLCASTLARRTFKPPL